MLPNTSISIGHVYIDVNDVPVRPPMQLGVAREPYKCMTPGNGMISSHWHTQVRAQSSVGNTMVTMSDIADVNSIHNTTISTNGNIIDNHMFTKSINSNHSNNTTTSNTTTSTPNTSPRKQERPQFIIPPRPPSEIGNNSTSNNNSWLSFFG